MAPCCTRTCVRKSSSQGSFRVVAFLESCSGTLGSVLEFRRNMILLPILRVPLVVSVVCVCVRARTHVQWRACACECVIGTSLHMCIYVSTATVCPVVHVVRLYTSNVSMQLNFRKLSRSPASCCIQHCQYLS